MTKIAIVVDAYSSAAGYPKSFERKDFSCIHIQTLNPLPSFYQRSFDPSVYLENIVFNGDYDALVMKLSAYKIHCVIAGIEPGVELADRLSSTLGLLSNGTNMSKAKRDKYEMALALRAKQLPTPHFTKVTTLEQLTSWKEISKVDYPIVLKPLRSAGTNGVTICNSDEELEEAFKNLSGSTSFFGEQNNEILAQSFLAGQEYVVNSVSLDGNPYVVAILRTKKRFVPSVGYIYDREKMMKREGSIQESLVSMHKKVLEALEIKHGPAHGEYMFTADGPVLIEVAARIAGGTNPAAHNESVGINQLDLNVDLYTDLETYQEKVKAPFERKKYFYDIDLSASNSGIAKNTEVFLSAVRALPSHFSSRLKVEEGQQVSQTVDLLSSTASVILVHPDKSTIERDYEMVVRLGNRLVEPLRVKPTKN